MNSINNEVHLIGNLGKDVIITTFESGSKKATVSLATTTYFKNNKGEVQKDTQWHNLTAWGRNAELMSQVLQKGSQVAVSGSIAYRTFEDKSGVTRTMAEILVDDFMKVNSNPSAADKTKSDVQVPF